MKNNWFTPFLGMTALVLIVLTNIAIAKDIERIVPGSETLSEAKKASPEEHAAKHADPTYICPMHLKSSKVRKAPVRFVA